MSERELRTMPASEFVRRMKESVEDSDRHYVLWLGAGCSVTAGIPAAGALVRDHWLPRLYRLRGGAGEPEAWAPSALPDYEPDNPAASYGALMAELFVNREERQRETERLCDGSVPGFAYAVLAALMSNDGGAFGTVLTTNFDDLVADAMYVFGDRRPLVIQHEALASFVRPGRVRRPLVVKLHGDHRLNPMHTAEETGELKTAVAAGVTRLLHDRGVVFIGYSGNDRGVIATLERLPSDALPLGVWWVSKREPRGAIRDWLEARAAVWVKADDFDKLMLLFREEFGIEHPTARKFERMVAGYRETYERLSSAVDRLPDSDVDSGALKEAARRASEAAPDWWGVELEARRYQESDPERADEIYRNGIEQTESPDLIGIYASFLAGPICRYDRAEELFERALELDPQNFRVLGNYANFCADVRDAPERARELYERALAAYPDDAGIVGNYANLQIVAFHDTRAAAHLYRRALVLDPLHVANLSNYAAFLAEVHQDLERARAMIERALAIDPSNVVVLANGAELLCEIGDEKQALELVARGLERPAAENPVAHAVLCFCLVAFASAPERDRGLTEIAGLVRRGMRTASWDSSRLVARLRREGREDAEWLELLGQVLAGRAEPATLDAWPDWPAAG